MNVDIRPVENWCPVAGYEGYYEVSDHGRVKSRRRPGATGKLLVSYVGKGGYLRATLCRPGVQKVVEVHVLVARAFLGSRPDGMQIRHLDGDPTNNQLTNLAYGTVSENAFDQLHHGRHFQASKTHCPSGHSYLDPKNLRLYRGYRYCRACQEIKGRKRNRSKTRTDAQ